MSAYITLETQFDDQDCLVGALRDMGFDPQVHSDTVQLQGWLKSNRQAEIVLSKASLRTHADIGFARNKNGKFDTIIDDLELRKLDQDKLAQTYAEKKTLSLAAAKGMKLTRREVDQTTNITRLVFQAAGSR